MLPPTFIAPLDLTQHPLSCAFPPMADEERLDLFDSINVNGIFNAITIHDGQVLDGNNRYQIAMEIGCPCPATQLADRVSPQDFVIAQNKMRRHITPGQIAMAVAGVHAWRPVGNPSFLQLDIECPVAKTNVELAKIAGVHPSTMKQAKVVQRAAEPQVIEAVRGGQIGLPKAEAIARLPRDQQVAAISAPLPKQPRAKRTSTPDLLSIKLPGSHPVESAQYVIDADQADVDADLKTRQRLLTSEEKVIALQQENSRLRADLAAMERARDDQMTRSNELLSELEALREKLEKLEAMNV